MAERGRAGFFGGGFGSGLASRGVPGGGFGPTRPPGLKPNFPPVLRQRPGPDNGKADPCCPDGTGAHPFLTPMPLYPPGGGGGGGGNGGVSGIRVGDSMGVGAPAGNIEPFEFRLLGTSSGPDTVNGWQRIDLPGPCFVRSSPYPGYTSILANTDYSAQYVGFLYTPGLRAPQSVDRAIHSRGIGDGFCWVGGPWWFRPVRPDIEVRLVFFPTLSPNVDHFPIEEGGAANFHAHYGLKLLPMANDGTTPGFPAADTYYIMSSYRIRKNGVIYVPRLVYEKTGGGTNWTDASDTTIDQEGNDALVGITEYFFTSAANYYKFNQWQLPSTRSIGEGLKTLRAGDRYTMSGDFRYPGAVGIFNLNPNSPAYITVEEWT